MTGYSHGANQVRCCVPEGRRRGGVVGMRPALWPASWPGAPPAAAAADRRTPARNGRVARGRLAQSRRLRGCSNSENSDDCGMTRGKMLSLRNRCGGIPAARPASGKIAFYRPSRIPP
ncbi:hypothetical protein A33K_14370 [Burkholderia humptydooensis MSMB43]|uniref:Uncharacterized protein n=1 Tax=Burkholderia humptydooensis MSMB43 TaxID=441157 RepID=A0ABN0G7T5_9BURK|nr:hypothetical protein A33K_14370 [Burkholderia humptydooensis MSMB43]